MLQPDRGMLGQLIRLLGSGCRDLQSNLTSCPELLILQVLILGLGATSGLCILVYFPSRRFYLLPDRTLPRSQGTRFLLPASMLRSRT
jgi:hypothetical protein